MKLKTKFSLGVLALIVAIVTGIGTSTVISEARLLKSEMAREQDQLILRVAHLCGESLYQDQLVLFNFFKNLQDERGFLGAGFVGTNGIVHIHSDPQKMGLALNSPQEAEALKAGDIFRQSYSENNRHVLDLAAPVNYGGQRAGTARVFLDQEVLQQFISSSLNRILIRMAVISVIAIFLGLLGAFWLAQTLAAPIEKIMAGMQEVAEGRLEPLPLPERSDEIGLMGKELNITIQKLKELDEMKRDFVSGVTHELRSPLTAIDRFVALLAKGTYGPLAAPQQESLVTIQNNTKRLISFVDDLLSTAKLESRRMDLYLSDFDVRDVIQDAYKLYGPTAQEKKLKFVLELPKVPLSVHADKDKVFQILSNLLSNAFKFTERGTVVMAARESAGKIHVAVSDTGMGISPEEQAQVFEKFYRVRETADKVKGTGLGLSLVKGLVDLLDGEIGLTPNQGGGSIFTFTLPKS